MKIGFNELSKNEGFDSDTGKYDEDDACILKMTRHQLIYLKYPEIKVIWNSLDSAASWNKYLNIFISSSS